MSISGLCQSQGMCHTGGVSPIPPPPLKFAFMLCCMTKGVYREEGMQLTMCPTYSSDFVSKAGYTKNRIQYTDRNKWAVYLQSYNYGRVHQSELAILEKCHDQS